jgi:Fe-S oxidoreductase
LLPLTQRIAFAIFAAITLTFAARGFYRLYLRIARGRPDPDPRLNHPIRRFWYALTTTLTQQRVFRKRRTWSLFHSFIFNAFVLYALVNLLDALEGYLTLPTLNAPPLHALYGILTDTFSLLAILGVLALMLRRFALPARQDFRFNPTTLLHPKVRNGFIARDSLIVSVFILFHVGSRIIGNAAKLALQGPDKYQPFSTFLAPAFAAHALAWRIFGYWGALGSILLFLLYFPYSKHLHLIAAPIKYFVHRDTTSGELPALPIDLDAAEPQLGAAHLADLSWPRLLDAYACIQCNRCQDVCPASHTGKSLSPAALEINKRMVLNDSAEEISFASLTSLSPFETNSPGPALLQAVISPESVWACTTCGACMEVCPTQNEQMLDIIDIRRQQVLLEGAFPPQLQSAFRNMERNSNPWGLASENRMAWADGLHVPLIDDTPNPDVLYWVGCAASFDPSAQKTARAIVQLLTEANINFAVLGKKETCTGDTARRAGNELLYQQLATTAIATLQAAHPKLVLASCPHCVNTIEREYPQFGGNFTVQHHTEYLQTLLTEGKLKPQPNHQTITFHDPCYLGRHRGTYAAPREVLHILSNNYVELDRTESNSFCCGAGGAQFWKEEEPGTERISENRFREAQQALSTAPKNFSSEKVLAVACPFCKSMLQSSPTAAEDTTILIQDVAEILLNSIVRTQTPPLAPPAIVPPTPTEQPIIPVAIAPTLPQPAEITPTPPPTTEPTPRKKWIPKSAATQPNEATAAEPTSAPRKKWQPKKSTEESSN